MLTIYCDVTIDSQNDVCAWGCLIQYKNRQYTHSGHTFGKVSTHYAELWALIKSLGMVKTFKVKEIEIYSDFQEVPVVGKKLVNLGSRKQVLKSLKGDFKSLYPLLINYMTTFQIVMIKISKIGNPAHEITISELDNAISEISPE